jgi:hypothetical protein
MTAVHPAPGQPEQFVLTIGDIGVSPSWIVTPNGSASLRDSQRTVQDRTFTQQKTPTWAIVMAVLGIVFCLLGLLFLIVKENQTSGYVEVTVRSGNVFHVVQLPANSPQAVAHARQLVYQAQSMASAIR